MTDAPAIIVKDLHKTYRDGLIFRRSFEALKGISLRVDHGEIFGLLGPNGAGKTTFVKLLLGIVRKTRGSAMMLDRPAGVLAGRKQIGYLPENLRIPRHHTALTALNLFGQLSGLSTSEIKSRRMELLESVELADRARDSVKKYSKGMVQRLGLAIALLHEPKLIFMDEPTDGLDPVGRAQVREALLRLKSQGITIFLNSHLLQEVELVCDRVAILDRGELRRVGTVEQLIPQRLETIQLELEVIGDENAVKSALRLLGGTTADLTPDQQSDDLSLQFRVLDPGHFALRVRLQEQKHVDRFVDGLRKRDVSIVSLIRHRVSLEEAFLTILRQTRDKP